MNHEFLYNKELLKEVIPRRKIKKVELKKLNDKISIIDASTRENKEEAKKLEIGKAELEHNLQIAIKRLENDIDEYDRNIDNVELELTENKQKQEELSTRIDNVITYVDQLEKQCIKKKEDLEHLHQKKLPVVKKAKDDKIYINNVYAKKIKTLEKEKVRNITNAQKTKKVTIKAFFKRRAGSEKTIEHDTKRDGKKSERER